MKTITRHLIAYITYVLIALFWSWWSVETGLYETIKNPFIFVLFFLSFIHTLRTFPIFKKEEEPFDPREESKKLNKLTK